MTIHLHMDSFKASEKQESLIQVDVDKTEWERNPLKQACAEKSTSCHLLSPRLKCPATTRSFGDTEVSFATQPNLIIPHFAFAPHFVIFCTVLKG